MGYRGAEMKKPRIPLAIPLLFLSLHAQGQKARVVQAETASCVNSPLLAELSKGSGTSLLSSYGYNLHEPWACTKISSSWAGESTLLHFQKVTAQSDDVTAFSVLKVAGAAHIWVIPTGDGMLEAPHAESDPHNLAAFNALLQSLCKAPTGAADWIAIGKLYMTLLGHKEALPVEAETGNPNPCSSEGDCSVAFADRVPHAHEPYTKWTLNFVAPRSSNPARIIDGTREVVPPSGG